MLGGGFVNTELRELKRPACVRLLRLRHAGCGRAPLAGACWSTCKAGGSRQRLVRTFLRDADSGRGAVREPGASPTLRSPKWARPPGTACPLDRYLSLLDMLNPMHRLWSDGRWNKLTVAHGCYWKKCSFCDVSLDYIGRYEGASAAVLADRIDAIVRETGQTGFHFVDEAAPPKSAEGTGRRTDRTQRRYFVVGKHSIRKDLHARTLRTAGR